VLTADFFIYAGKSHIAKFLEKSVKMAKSTMQNGKNYKSIAKITK
jgi:hypothetical protein